MNIQPEKSGDSHSRYQTADELLSHPACTHIISVPPAWVARVELHNQHIHLERHEGALRATYNFGVSRLRTEDYPSLEELYQRNPRWRELLWQDISAYPALPYDTRYRPLTDPIEIWAMPDDTSSHHGSYLAYGRAEVVSLSPSYRKHIHTLDNWLIVKHPGRTWHVVSTKLVGKKRGPVGRAFHNFLYRKGFYHFLMQVKLRSPFIREQPSRTEREADFLVVYGQPPSNWPDAPQHDLSTERSS